MTRPNKVEKEILSLLGDSPATMRDMEHKLGRRWNAIYWNLKDKNNQKNLLIRGCVEEVRKVDETTNRAQDMYEYKLTEKGRQGCPL